MNFGCTCYLIYALFHWNKGRGLDRYKDSFNYWLSHFRQAVEHAFGMLTQRWGNFWRPFLFLFDRWSLVTLVTMKLHNFCLDRSDTIPLRRFYEDIREGDQWVVYDNARDDDISLRGRALGDRCRTITQNLENHGIVRPKHAASNSRTNNL
jgi:hypothetical protein